MTFAERISKGGYNIGEVASALQKCIRRGLEEDALFWATELDLSGFGEYVWKRLRIIASEDVGWTEPQITVEIRALYEAWKDQRKKDDAKHEPERLFLVDAVIRLSRCQKSRAVDHALIVFYEGKRAEREIPDFALDRHTSRGRGMRRGWKHFWDEGARVHNPGPCHDPYAERARAIRHDKQAEMDL